MSLDIGSHLGSSWDKMKDNDTIKVLGKGGGTEVGLLSWLFSALSVNTLTFGCRARLNISNLLVSIIIDSCCSSLRARLMSDYCPELLLPTTKVNRTL